MTVQSFCFNTGERYALQAGGGLGWLHAVDLLLLPCSPASSTPSTGPTPS